MPGFRWLVRVNLKKNIIKPIGKAFHIAAVSILEPIIIKGITKGMDDNTDRMIKGAVDTIWLPFVEPAYTFGVICKRSYLVYQTKANGQDHLFLVYGVSTVFAVGSLVCQTSRFVFMAFDCSMMAGGLHFGAWALGAMGDTIANKTIGFF